MKITQDVREYAAYKETDGRAAVGLGKEELDKYAKYCQLPNARSLTKDLMPKIFPTEIRTLKEIIDGMQSYCFGHYWPPEYNDLFRSWGYFNRIYDTLYTDNAEWERIARFAIDDRFKAIWNELQGMDDVRTLSQQPCVGNGRKEFVPAKRIRNAFSTLRLVNQIDVKEVCQSKKCLERKKREWDVCLNDALVTVYQDTANIEEANLTAFGATLLIVYQIRCNLFHGSKTEMSGEELARNQLLVGAAARFMARLLEVLATISKTMA